MERSRSSAVVLAALALVLAAPAASAPKPVRFAISVRATTQVQWTLNDTLNTTCAGGPGGLESGSGTESST